jgi:hypothetical protein
MRTFGAGLGGTVENWQLHPPAALAGMKGRNRPPLWSRKTAATSLFWFCPVRAPSVYGVKDGTRTPPLTRTIGRRSGAEVFDLPAVIGGVPSTCRKMKGSTGRKNKQNRIRKSRLEAVAEQWRKCRNCRRLEKQNIERENRKREQRGMDRPL